MQIQNLSIQIIIATLVLLVFGGLIQHDASLLNCTSWPGCGSELWKNSQVLVELIHRGLGSLIGLLTIYLVVKAFKSEQSTKLKKLSVQALFFLVLQGALGAATALYKLPSDVSTIHLIFSAIYLGLLVNIHHTTSWKPLSEKKVTLFQNELEWSGNYKYWALFGLLVILFQFFLGGFVRHSGASAACGLGMENALSCIKMGSWERTWWPAHIPSQINMLHRLFSIVGSIYLFTMTLKLFKKLIPYEEEGLKLTSYLIGIFTCLLALMFSGLSVTIFNLNESSMVLHLIISVFLLGLIWKLYLIFRSIEQEVYPEGIHTIVSDLLDLTKPRLGALVMVTCLVGVLIAPAQGYFGTSILSFFLTAMVVMSATTLNCYIEREVDKLMERTKNRPLPMGRMKPVTALIFGLILLIISFPALWILVNPTTAILGLIAHILYLFAYTPLKRKSVWSLYVGAIPGAIPPIMGWTTVMGKMDPMGWVLFSILFIWQLPHFMAISIYHQTDYEAAGISIYPTFCSQRLMKHLILGLTIVLAVVSFLPIVIGFLGTSYFLVSLVCNILFIGTALKGYWVDGAGYTKWAKQYFWGSIIYLPLVLGSMIVVR